MSKQTGIQLGSIVVALLAVIAIATTAAAQSTSDQHSEHGQHQQPDQKDLQEQIREMQTKIAKLEAALKQNHSAMKMNSDGQMQGMKGKAGGMEIGMKGMKSGKGGMSGMAQDKGEMSGMSKGGMMGGMKGGKKGSSMAGMSGQDQSMSGKRGMAMMGRGMQMMGNMKSMGEMETPSSLPGFPGASHIYHIGADGFFLDHPEHITLTTDQQSMLNKLKEQTMLQQADFDRKIEAVEQELWVLTSSDSPDAKKIEDKIAAVTKLQGQQRLAYIRAIGEAASTLTIDQRRLLTGASENGDSGK